MRRKLRNRFQKVKPTQNGLYKLIPLAFIVFVLLMTIGIGIADPTFPPIPPPPGGN